MWLDWAAALVMFGFALRGWFQGLVRQIFDLLGWVGGIGSCLWVSQWVGAHWNGARPAVVFGALGWLIAVLVGLAIKALFDVAGHRLSKGPGDSGVGIPGRIGGLALGVGIGGALVSALVLGLLLTPWPESVARAAARSQVAGVVISGGRALDDVSERWVPGSGALRRAVDAAARRSVELSRKS